MKRSIGFRPAAFLVGIAVVISAVPQSASAFPDHGRFLRDPSNSSIVGVWGNTGGGTPPSQPIAFDRTVTDTAKNINAGQIKFDYDTYAHQDGQRGGAALSGGFYLNNNVWLKDNFSLAWVQTIIATRTGTDGINNWNLPGTNAGEYPDADPMDRFPLPNPNPNHDPGYAPSYPFDTPSVVPANMDPNGKGPGYRGGLGFQDLPNRFFSDGNQSWLAELGLVCINNNLGADGFREVRVISTFLWGFNLNGLPAANPGIGNVGANPPAFWSPPTQSYLDSLNGFYDGMGGGGGNNGQGPLPQVASALYRFADNSNCFRDTPEPATGLLLLVVSLIGLRRRHS